MPRTRKFSGPLRPGTKSTRTRVAKKPRGGLNKTEKKQTKAIVNSAIKKEHTLKYFDSDNTETAAAPNTSTVGSALKQVSVLGYSSTTEKDNAGVTLKYGSQDIVPLYLSKTFRKDQGDTVLAENAPNGNTVAPKIARAAFSIERVFNSVNYEAAPSNPPDDSAHNLPITFRVIKVAFKTQVGTAEVLDPNLDLMLDYRTGVPTGINQSGFDRLQCRYGKLNTKKYTKLSDTMFTLNQDNIITPQFHTATAGGEAIPAQFFQKNGASIKHMVVPFQLSQRKNGKLYYEDPNGATTLDTFTSGGQRQMLFIHAWFDNGHLLLGGDDRPSAPTSLDVQIKHKCQSAFVDTM